MGYIILIIIGVILFFVGNFIFDEFDGDTPLIIGEIMLLVGIGLIVYGLFMTRPIDTQAAEIQETKYIHGAGVTAHMNATLYSALNEPELTVTEDDIDLLARMITAEQGYGANETDYYMTGSVVLNRVASSKFPNTVRDVINQSGQYQCVTNGHINREYDDVAWEVAEELLTEGTTIDGKVVYQAEFTQGHGIYTQRGKTFYCYE